MDKLNDFLKNKEFDSTINLVSNEFINNVQSITNIKFGVQLREYILKYGYIGYKFLELYGINSKQGMNSDLIKQTLYLHQYFERTKQYYALANEGDGEYILINSEDKIFSFDSDTNEIISLDIKFEDYLINTMKQMEE